MGPVAWPRVQPLGQSVLLKFSLETRLESKSFEPLIDFLAFLVQKLWSNINNNFTNLHHNFWTRNPSRSSKVSKDSDCSLVSSKNFSEILPPNGWRPGSGKVGQGGLKVLHLWRHSQKNSPPKQKNFFWKKRVPTRRLAASFETFTGSVEHTRLEKFLHKATCI